MNNKLWLWKKHQADDIDLNECKGETQIASNFGDFTQYDQLFSQPFIIVTKMPVLIEKTEKLKTDWKELVLCYYQHMSEIHNRPYQV